MEWREGEGRKVDSHTLIVPEVLLETPTDITHTEPTLEGVSGEGRVTLGGGDERRPTEAEIFTGPSTVNL